MSEITPGTISISSSIKFGWKNVVESQYGTAILMTLVYVVIACVVSIVADNLDRMVPYLGSLLAFVASPLYVGLPFAFVRKIRGEQLQFEMLFQGFSRFVPLLLAGLVIGLCYLACAIPAGRAAVLLASWLGKVGVALAGLLMVVLMIVLSYVSIRLYFVQFIILDNPPGLPLKDALKRSWNMTKEPVALKLFLLVIVLGLICIACTVLLVIPVLLVGIPLAMSTIAVVYELIRPVTSSETAQAGPAAVRKFSCAYCGYSKDGLHHPICPECGARNDG